MGFTVHTHFCATLLFSPRCNVTFTLSDTERWTTDPDPEPEKARELDEKTKVLKNSAAQGHTHAPPSLTSPLRHAITLEHKNFGRAYFQTRRSSEWITRHYNAARPQKTTL